jgi:hypothetical protein
MKTKDKHQSIVNKDSIKDKDRYQKIGTSIVLLLASNIVNAAQTLIVPTVIDKDSYCYYC